MPLTFLQRRAGPILIALGAFIFCANLDRAATHLSHFVDAFPGRAIGLLPAAIVTTAQLVQACGNERNLMQTCLLHTLFSSWPLLLVAAGALLSHEASKK